MNEQNNLNIEASKQEIDFSGKDFEATQELLGATAKISTLTHDSARLKEEKDNVVNSSIKGDDSLDVIQAHLDKFRTPEELERYLSGKLTDERVKNRINEFFTNDETGEVLELVENPQVKNETNELDFKRGLLLYFKQNDYYLSKIDEECEKLNKATEELTSDLSEALNPLKDNILNYANYLLDTSVINDDDTSDVKRMKRMHAKKAIAIRSGYSLENMISLIEKNPSIVKNALKDFRNETKIKDIGERYARKLKTAKINFNLLSLIADDIHGSLEYRTIPQGDYPEGLENFTVFFIVRAMSMGLTTPEDITFHASAQIALNKFVDNTLDPDIIEYMRKNIIKFLSYFDED